MKVSVLCNDGSPLGVTENSVYGADGRNGVGGAELALMTVCRGLHDRGHEVILYNNAVAGSVFEHRSIESFRPKDQRDALIVFRSPVPQHKTVSANGKKVWWSCDQFTIGDFKEFSTRVDAIVGISPFHRDYFKSIYGIDSMQVIDIPVRTWEYTGETIKNPKSFIFTSVPDRGLMQLLPIWKEIVKKVPEAQLTITSDWTLWTGEKSHPATSGYRLAWAGVPNVNYVGAINRNELVKIQEGASYHLYPCIYEELFCISVAESQVAGAIPITSHTGAIETTNRFGYKVDGNPLDARYYRGFVDKVLEVMTTTTEPIADKAKKEFGLDKIIDQWERVLFDNEKTSSNN